MLLFGLGFATAIALVAAGYLGGLVSFVKTQEDNLGDKLKGK